MPDLDLSNTENYLLALDSVLSFLTMKSLVTKAAQIR